MIRELDFSRLTIRLRQREKDSDHEKVYAKLSGQTREVLQKHLVRAKVAFACTQLTETSTAPCLWFLLETMAGQARSIFN